MLEIDAWVGQAITDAGAASSYVDYARADGPVILTAQAR